MQDRAYRVNSLDHGIADRIINASKNVKFAQKMKPRLLALKIVTDSSNQNDDI